MASKDLWYTLGYTIESIRLRREARRGVGGSPLPGGSPSGDLFQHLLVALSAAGAGLLAHHLVGRTSAEKRPAAGLRRIFAGGWAGALSAGATELFRPALTTTPRSLSFPRTLARALVRGAGRGMAFAALAAPRLRGPRVLRGTAFGALEYLLAPWGGLAGVAGRRGRGGGLQLFSLLVPAEEREKEAFLYLVAYGILLAYLYE